MSLEYLDDIDFGETPLSEEDKSTLEKLNYKNMPSLIKGIANKERMISQSIRFPDDKSTDEDKNRFNERITKYLGVPEKPEDYKIERPTEMPEGMEYDLKMENDFRNLAYASKFPPSAVNAIINWYNKKQIDEYKARNEIAKNSEQSLREEWGNDFTKRLGDPADEKSIGTVKKAIMRLSQILGMDYTDEKGNPQSHLIDELELIRPQGKFGDKVNIIKVFSWIYDNMFAEGKTFFGEQTIPSKEGGGFFDYKSMDKKE